LSRTPSGEIGEGGRQGERGHPAAEERLHFQIILEEYFTCKNSSQCNVLQKLAVREVCISDVLKPPITLVSVCESAHPPVQPYKKSCTVLPVVPVLKYLEDIRKGGIVVV